MQWIALSAWYVLARFARVSPTDCGCGIVPGERASIRSAGVLADSRAAAGGSGPAVTAGRRPARLEGTAEASSGGCGGGADSPLRHRPGPRADRADTGAEQHANSPGRGVDGWSAGVGRPPAGPGRRRGQPGPRRGWPAGFRGRYGSGSY